MRKTPLLLTALFFVVFFLSYLGPVIEGDFFHHAAAGKALAGGAPIALKFPTQWLGQAFLYGLYAPGGVNAVIVFRAASYAFILLVLFLMMRRDRVPAYERLIFILVPAHLLISFPSERPQMLSFLLFAITVWLMEAWRGSEKSKAAYAVPIVLAVWANVHAGFILGLAAVWAYFAGDLISYSANRSQDNLARLKKSGALALIPAALALMMPGAASFAIGSVKGLFVRSEYMSSIQEYLSPVTAAVKLGEYYPSFWAAIGLAAFTMALRFRRMPPAHIILLILFSCLGLSGLRFMPFIAFLSPLTARYNVSQRAELDDSKALAAGFVLLIALWAVFFVPKGRWFGIRGDFPVKAASFMNARNPEGRLFAYQGWAGYIELASPGREPFLGVEGVKSEIDEAYAKIIWASESKDLGMPEWRALLEAYGIDIIMMPGISPVSGEFFPIIDALQSDPEWFLVYQDETANIFIRSEGRNGKIISVYSLPKPNAFIQIEKQALGYLSEKSQRPEPVRANLWKALAESYAKRGMRKEYEEAFKKLREIEGK